MTLVQDPEPVVAASLLRGDEPVETPGPAAAAGAPAGAGPDAAPAEPDGPPGGRSLAVAFLSAGAVALTTGGIFGSWPARLLSLVSVAIGVGWAALAVRQRRRQTFYTAGVLPLAVVLAMATLLFGAGSASGGPLGLVQQAVRAGRLLRPPIPFDPGWRPLLVIIFLLLGFSSAWIGATRGRPQLSLVIPLPLLLLAEISQPGNEQLLAGILAFVPLVAGLAVLFGGDGRSTANLSRAFELRRAARGAVLLLPAVGALVLLDQTSFLFPKPAYNPQSKPQKPRAVPLSALTNTVLFEVKGTITGPWKTGDLDVYQAGNWLLPPYLNKDVKSVPGDGRVAPAQPGGTTSVTFTVRDLGTTAVLPGLVGAVAISTHGQNLVYDSRDGTFRERTGRVPGGLVYTESLPDYPTPTALRAAPPLPGGYDKTFLSAPAPPPAVQTLLLQAPTNTWDRLSFLLSKESAVEIAAGSGGPVPVTPATVQRILAGDHKGTPFELVATQALLARWAGVPSRIGFGFDGFDQANGVATIRPDDAAQWVEVYFSGHGWIPLVTTPPRAEASLNRDQNVKFNPLIQPDTDVGVSIYVPVRVQNLTALYQEIRGILLGLLPFLAAALTAYLAEPAALRWLRRIRRRRWAAAHSPEAAVLVEYCEMRDYAADLGIGDPFATPLEFLDFLAEDDEHQELAWLVTRALYGDMAGAAEAGDVESAREMARSLRRRMGAAQPFQSRALAALARTSLHEPYNREIPDHPLKLLSRLRRPRLPRLTGVRA